MPFKLPRSKSNMNGTKTPFGAKPFTVVLIFPDYIGGQYGDEFYVAYVRAANPARALRKARQKAAVKFDPNDPNDFGLVFCCAGHAYCLNRKAEP